MANDDEPPRLDYQSQMPPPRTHVVVSAVMFIGGVMGGASLAFIAGLMGFAFVSMVLDARLIPIVAGSAYGAPMIVGLLCNRYRDWRSFGFGLAFAPILGTLTVLLISALRQ